MPVTEVRESQLGMKITSKISRHFRSAIKNTSDKFFRFASVMEEMNHYNKSGHSSKKHISHGQVYNQVLGTSAKITVLKKRIIDRRFTSTTATVTVRNTDNHVLHLAEEILLGNIVFF